MPAQERPKIPQQLAGGKFDIDKRLGAGCFGEVYRGHFADNKESLVAVKFEDCQSHALQLGHEAETMRVLAKGLPAGTPPGALQPQGFAEIFYFGREGRYHSLVMEILGRSLEDMMQKCGGKWKVNTCVLVATQVLCRIEFLHSKGIVHRDIKPENFMFGVGPKIHHVYAIDFGLSKRYYDVKHVQIRTRLSLTGTARYASINAHRGVEQSRRDDLEAIGHMFMYFLRGSLPWSGLDAKTQEEKYRKIREKKEEVPLKELCTGFPDEFAEYLSITRGLDFKERPDYNHLRQLFRNVRDREGKALEDHNYQWFDGKDLGKLEPLYPWPGVRQPDDAQPGGKSCGFCFCGGKSATKD